MHRWMGPSNGWMEADGASLPQPVVWGKRWDGETRSSLWGCGAALCPLEHLWGSADPVLTVGARRSGAGLFAASCGSRTWQRGWCPSD